MLRGRKLAAAVVVLAAVGWKATADVADLSPGPTYNQLSAAPPMGWNDWNQFQCDIDEQTILAEAHALVSTGLASAGYNTVGVDDCWEAAARDDADNLTADPVKFPQGMAYLGEQIHALGLRFGLYSDAGEYTCGGFPGSWEHWQQDANTFAAWGVDYLKFDNCYVPTVAGEEYESTFRRAYGDMSAALVNSGRPIIFGASAPRQFQGGSNWQHVVEWTAGLSNLSREGTDIALAQQSGDDKWQSMLTNYDYNVGLSEFARPGHWNDPDFLLTGTGGLTAIEMQTQMTLWAEMAAPLVTSVDLDDMDEISLGILGKSDVIAVDQDSLGDQGVVVQRSDNGDILSKPLSNGDTAVVLFNRSEQDRSMSITTSTVGIHSAGKYSVKNLVDKTVSVSTGSIGATVPAHGTVIYRVSALG